MLLVYNYHNIFFHIPTEFLNIAIKYDSLC